MTEYQYYWLKDELEREPEAPETDEIKNPHSTAIGQGQGKILTLN